jgi:hypothetical protein
MNVACDEFAGDEAKEFMINPTPTHPDALQPPLKNPNFAIRGIIIQEYCMQHWGNSTMDKIDYCTVECIRYK